MAPNVDTATEEEGCLVSGRPASAIVPRTYKRSVTSDLFQQWLKSSDDAEPRDPRSHCLSPSSSTSDSTLRPLATAQLPEIVINNDLELLEQNDRLMELILDISNELDINNLCHKILSNVRQLTNADRCSLFLARGPRENRYLEAKLFDVDARSTSDETMRGPTKENMRIPFGVGICGHVAQTKEIINLKDAYEDPRFDEEIDEQTGYRTRSLVCMPVCNYDGEVVGVAQLMNNRGNGNHDITELDLRVLQRYLTFCGIGIQNAQLFEVSLLEYKQNDLLLSLARSLFQEQMSLERLVTIIITKAKDLLKCERCTVYLLDLKVYDTMNSDHFLFNCNGLGLVPTPTCDTNTSNKLVNRHSSGVNTEIAASTNVGVSGLGSQTNSAGRSSRGCGTSSPTKREVNTSGVTFHRAWELQEGNQEVQVLAQSDIELLMSRRAKIARHVAATSEVLNLNNVASWFVEKQPDDRDGFVPRTMLSLPIFNGQKAVVGVAQLVNKKQKDVFVEADIAVFEAFAIFCGIGIHNTTMYEGACRLMAKQKVALDCLSYHAAATDDDAETLAKSQIPDANSVLLFSYKFSDLSMGDLETCKATVRMFLEFNLVSQFLIPYSVLCRWILSVKKNYRPVKYHNWRHALNVCQTMFTVLKTGKMDRFMNDLEIFGLLVACLCHDLDHRGTNNAFQSKVVSPLAILYSTSTMEHHHFDQCVMILNSAENNIFQGLNTVDYRRVMKVVEQAILSTDMALYFKKKHQFLEAANRGEIDWQEDGKKELLCGMLMTACDVSAIAKPWEIQHKTAKMVADEFFDQGDLEKLRLNQQPMAMMDRERKDELPQMQVEFIDFVCVPLYTSLSESFPWIKPLLDGCLANREKWADLAEKVEMGLTWIDHETIDKPIEEMGTGEANDIEFHVETLKCNSTNKPKKEVRSSIKKSFRARQGSSNSSGSGKQNFFQRRLSSKSQSRSKWLGPATAAEQQGVSSPTRTSSSSSSSQLTVSTTHGYLNVPVMSASRKGSTSSLYSTDDGGVGSLVLSQHAELV